MAKGRTQKPKKEKDEEQLHNQGTSKNLAKAALKDTGTARKTPGTKGGSASGG